jgi:hypothetical protein
MEHWWNEIDRGKPKYSGKNLSQCHFVHYKSHMDYPGLRGERPATNRLSHGLGIQLKLQPRRQPPETSPPWECQIL